MTRTGDGQRACSTDVTSTYATALRRGCNPDAARAIALAARAIALAAGLAPADRPREGIGNPAGGASPSAGPLPLTQSPEHEVRPVRLVEITPEQRERRREQRRRYRHSQSGQAQSRRHDADPERRRRKKRKLRARHRLARGKALTLLGGRCARCGTTDRLEIDHVHGDAYVERRHSADARKSNPTYYHRILRSVLADEKRYQALCRSCNLAKARTEDVETRRRMTA